MNNISNLLNYEEKEKTTAPHELSDSVCYIKENIGLTPRYNFGYWLAKVKTKGLTHFQVKELVDKALSLPEKYNRGGWLSNQLK